MLLSNSTHSVTRTQDVHNAQSFTNELIYLLFNKASKTVLIKDVFIQMFFGSHLLLI